MPGADLIAAERKRQLEAEGWSFEHDDEHNRGELALAAAAYATGRVTLWPWPGEGSFKPTGDSTRDLVKAGALIAAEIDRLQRTQAE